MRFTKLVFGLVWCGLVGCGNDSEAPDGAVRVPDPIVAPTPLPTPGQAAGDGQGTVRNEVVEVVPGAFLLGEIEPGSEHSRQFVIRNDSANPVRVERTVTSCKCTTTSEIAGAVIAPGSELAFEAILRAPRTPGNKSAKVQVFFGGGARPLTMEIAGDVTMPIHALPAYVGGPRGTDISGTVVLRSLDGVPFDVLQAGGAAPVFVGETSARSTYTLRWDVNAVAEVDRYHWWVVFTTHPDCPVLPLGIRSQTKTGSKRDTARFERYWIFDEDAVNAERIAPGSTSEFEVTIKHYNPRGRGRVERADWMQIISVESLHPDATAELLAATPQADDQLRVRFRFTPSPTFSGPMHALIAVRTATGTGECAVLALVKD